MNFADVASGSAIFIDANIFVYAFAPDPQFGQNCTRFLERIENHDLIGFSSTHVLSDVAHRLMTIEACATFGWPFAGVAKRLERHPADAQKLTRFRAAVEAIIAIGIQTIPVLSRHIIAAAVASQQTGLLSNDALIVALMREHGLDLIASYDTDFDRIKGIQRIESL